MSTSTTRALLAIAALSLGTGCVESAPGTSNSGTADAGETSNNDTDAGPGSDTGITPGERGLVIRLMSPLEVGVKEPFEVVLVDEDGSESLLASSEYTIQVEGAQQVDGELLADAPGEGTIAVGHDDLKAETTFDVDFELQKVAVGLDVACVLTARGRVWCWGTNESGELGRGTTSANMDEVVEFGPTLHTFDGPVVDVDCGLNACVAITEPGSIFSWGSREDNRLGRTTATFENPTPEQVELAGFVAVDLAFEAEHGCVVDRDAKLACWGDNSRGQLGEGSTNDRVIRLYDDIRVKAVDVGNDATCYIDRDTETLFCAGSSAWLPSNGGDVLTFTELLVPGGVSAQADSIGVGDQHMCAIAGEDVWCLGEKRSFEGPPEDYNVSLGSSLMLPKVEGSPQLLIVGDDMNFILSDNGQWYSFGENERGVAGTQNRVSDYDGPRVQAPGNQPIRHVATATENTCIVTESSEIFCVGNDNFGLLGPDIVSTSETWVEILPPWK